MKKIISAAILFATTTAAVAQVNVQGYTRRDGTYVAPHVRSAPDNSYNNNYGTSPNTNIYSGQQGTNQPTYNDRPPPSNPYNNYGTGRRY